MKKIPIYESKASINEAKIPKNISDFAKDKGGAEMKKIPVYESKDDDIWKNIIDKFAKHLELENGYPVEDYYSDDYVIGDSPNGGDDINLSAKNFWNSLTEEEKNFTKLTKLTDYYIRYKIAKNEKDTSL